MLHTVTVTGFPGPDFIGPVPGRQLDLLLHGLVAGKHWYANLPDPAARGSWTLPNMNAAAYSLNERIELAGLFLLLSAYTETDPAGDVCTTSYYHQLETTEKAQASARLGVAVTSFLAWKILDVPALHHVVPILRWMQIPQGGRRPDFIGQDTSAGWHVLESKGSARDAVTPGFVARGKRQASAVTSVLNSAPASNSLAVGLLRTTAGPIHGHLEDPPPDDDDRAVLLDDFDRAPLEKRRYGPFARAMAGDATSVAVSLEDGLSARLFELPGVGYIGLAERLASTVERYVALGEDPARDAALAEDIGQARREVSAALSQPDRRGDGPASEPQTTFALDDATYEVAISGDGIVLAARDALSRTVRA